MEPLRIGIIGVGIIGKSHLREWQEIGGVEVVAACDIDSAELNRVGDLYNIPHRYSDFRELLKRDDIVAVDVCLHNNLHAPVTIAALRAGKHVYCEKPMAGAYWDAKEMLRVARETNQHLHIQLSTLYTPQVRIAKRFLDAGRLGKVYHARSTGFRRRGRPYVDGYATKEFVQKEIAAGGALFDMGVYHISQMLYLLGMPNVERVSGRVYQETDMDAHRREVSGYSVEELGTGFVRFEGDLTLDIIEAWAIHLNGMEGGCIVGSQGGLRLDPLSFHSTEEDVETNWTFEAGGTNWRWHQLDPMLAHYDSSQRHWKAALLGLVPLLPTAEIALKTMLISEGIYLSGRLGREVTREEIESLATSTALNL
jgi:predicted dehydrogenase